jgi:hypothetical protein
MDVKAEIDSMIVQSKRAESVRGALIEPNDYEWKYVFAVCERAYTPIATIVNEWDSYENFVRVVKELDRSSSPGFPYNREAPTIGEWLKFVGFPDPVRMAELWFDVKRVFEGRYDHIFRVFIKAEPHSMAKVKERRFRLIIAASLPVQVAWTMVFGRMNDTEIARWSQIPSAQGMMIPKGAWRYAQRHMRKRGLCWEADKSAWDFNAPGWVMDMDLQLRSALAIGRDAKWDKVAKWLYDDAFKNARLMLSNGMVFRQQFSGFMKSGIVNTISTNSHAQYMQHVLACLRLEVPLVPMIAAGDDVLMAEPPAGYQAELERTGCVVKFCRPGRAFLGIDWASVPRPLYFTRHIWHYLYQADEFLGETLDAYAISWCHQPRMYEFWRLVAAAHGMKVTSPSSALFWFDGC